MKVLLAFVLLVSGCAVTVTTSVDGGGMADGDVSDAGTDQGCAFGCAPGLECYQGHCSDLACVSPHGECDIYATGGSRACPAGERCQVVIETLAFEDRRTECVPYGTATDACDLDHACTQNHVCVAGHCRPECGMGLCRVNWPCEAIYPYTPGATCHWIDPFGRGACY